MDVRREPQGVPCCFFKQSRRFTERPIRPLVFTFSFFAPCSIASFVCFAIVVAKGALVELSASFSSFPATSTAAAAAAALTIVTSVVAVVGVLTAGPPPIKGHEATVVGGIQLHRVVKQVRLIKA